MSSKDKITVQDQSKEKGVSGSLKFAEERESSPGKAAAAAAASDRSPRKVSNCDGSVLRQLHRVQGGRGRPGRTRRQPGTPTALMGFIKD